MVDFDGFHVGKYTIHYMDGFGSGYNYSITIGGWQLKRLFFMFTPIFGGFMMHFDLRITTKTR